MSSIAKYFFALGSQLRLGIIKQKDVELAALYYAVYSCRFIEMLLTRFDNEFTSAQATDHKSEPDSF